VKIHKTVIKPYVIYGVELWTLIKKDEDALATWERKILRRIYGPKHINNEWKTQTNEEIMNMFNSPDIISTIKSKRIEWLGHTQRMARERGYLKTNQMADGEWEDQD
jgi:hypothetical protein